MILLPRSEAVVSVTYNCSSASRVSRLACESFNSVFSDVTHASSFSKASQTVPVARTTSSRPTRLRGVE